MDLEAVPDVRARRKAPNMLPLNSSFRTNRSNRIPDPWVAHLTRVSLHSACGEFAIGSKPSLTIM
jgi:hypothetical protein